jgi:hypothetical protein
MHGLENRVGQEWGDMRRRPLTAGEFEAVLSVAAMDHRLRDDMPMAIADPARVLKPGGLFFACVPHWESSWAWGDPGHTRVIPRDSLLFLSQAAYEGQVGSTPMTDYRPWYKADFETAGVNEDNPDVLQFVLRAIKE